MKKKKIYSPLLFASSFLLTSCGKVTNDAALNNIITIVCYGAVIGAIGLIILGWISDDY